MKAARSATSVLPKPASPQISRSIGLDRAEIADDLVDRGLLVGRLLELEALAEVLEVAARMRERMALGDLARGIDIEQVGSHREHRLPRAFLDPIPRAAAELVELGLVAVAAADVALDQVDALDRHVHRVVAGIFQIQEIALGIGDLEMLESAITPDAVIDMHDHVVGPELFQIEQRALAVAARSAASRARLAEEIFFAVNVQPVLLQHGARRRFRLP